MSEISGFYGIRITINFRDHQPPHFHAEYGDDEVLIVIRTGDVYQGGLPRRALRMVQEWTALHRDELLALWDLAQAKSPLRTTAPLD